MTVTARPDRLSREGWTIQARFTAVVAVVLGLVALTVFEYYPRRLAEAKRLVIEEKAHGLATAVAVGAGVGLDLGDPAEIATAVELARADPDFHAVEVRDVDGRTVGGHGDVEAPGLPGDLVARVTVPITHLDRALGEVELVLSLERLDATVAGHRRTGLLICAAILAFGVLLAAVGSRRITRPLSALAAAADRIAGGDLAAALPEPPPDREVRQLAAAFENMRLQVRQALDGLRTQSSEMRVMLDNLQEGLFTFEPDLSINPEYSPRAAEILGVADLSAARLTDLFPLSPRDVEELRDWVGLMTGPRAMANLVPFARLHPFRAFARETPAGPRHVIVECRPVVAGGRVARFLMLVRDVTEERAARDKLERQRWEEQLHIDRILALVRNERTDVDALLRESREALAGFGDGEAGGELSIEELRRRVHTLKGNSGSLGFSALAAAFGAVEAHLYPTGRDGDVRAVSAGHEAEHEAVLEELGEIVKWRRRLFADRADRFGVDRRAYESLLGDLAAGVVPLGEVEARLRDLPARPLREYARRYQRFVESYGEASGKRLELRVLTPAVRIAPEAMRALDGSVVQLVRNAADHGIESDEERRAAGKGPGRITLSAAVTDGAVELTVADDGRGIDGDAVTRAAVAAGLLEPGRAESLSEEERIRLVLRSEVTTRGEAGEISGRGVGLDVVAAAMESLGGSLALDTEKGRGCRVTLRMRLAEAPEAQTVVHTGEGDGTDTGRRG